MPRCKMCAAPFGRPGRHPHAVPWTGSPWEKNPEYCRACFDDADANTTGVPRLESSFLFADIRGSTTLAEEHEPDGVPASCLNRFYEVATRDPVANDGIVDKFVGDEVDRDLHPGTRAEHHAVQRDRRRPRAA